MSEHGFSSHVFAFALKNLGRSVLSKQLKVLIPGAFHQDRHAPARIILDNRCFGINKLGLDLLLPRQRLQCIK